MSSTNERAVSQPDRQFGIILLAVECFSVPASALLMLPMPARSQTVPITQFKGNQFKGSQFKSFADWCLKKATLPAATRRTVDVLMKRSRTTDCYQASEMLSSITTLDLSDSKISDLSPLQVLTELEALYLGNNQITDLKPLSFSH